jgi:hypothetical protein
MVKLKSSPKTGQVYVFQRLPVNSLVFTRLGVPLPTALVTMVLDTEQLALYQGAEKVADKKNVLLQTRWRIARQRQTDVR